MCVFKAYQADLQLLHGACRNLSPGCQKQSQTLQESGLMTVLVFLSAGGKGVLHAGLIVKIEVRVHAKPDACFQRGSGDLGKT